MKAELFYFDGCPSWAGALDNLIEALALERTHADIETIRVRDDADARHKRFIGSPTIRIDGVDLEGPEADDRGFAFGCRVYTEGGRTSGSPSVALIREALRRART